MVLKGGVLQFTSQDETIQKEALLAILNHQETKISKIHEDSRDGIVFVFKITFDSNFQHYFRPSSLIKVEPSSTKVIILKFFVYTCKQLDTGTYGYDMDQYTREINIAKELGAQANVDPICPSFLYEVSITQFGSVEHDSNSLFSLLKLNLEDEEAEKGVGTLYDDIESYTLKAFNRDYERLTQKAEIDSLSSLSGRLLFMEFFDCCTLLDFCDKDKIHYSSASSSHLTSINGRDLQEASSIHLENTLFGLSKKSFMTLVIHLLSLQLFDLRCIHGDLHPNNVFIFVENEDIKLKIIDFGRSKYWATEAEMEAELELDTDIPRATTNKLLLELYDRVKTTATETNIYTTIKRHIQDKNYLNAVCIIGMCRVLTKYKSPFHFYLNKPIGSPYSNMYELIPPEELVAYKTIITGVLYTPTSEGGSSIYKNRINKFIASKQINNKSKKSKKRKKKTINRKKSRKITRKKLQNRRQK